MPHFWGSHPYQSGQSCIGVQRILIHEQVYDAFRDKLVAASRDIKMGNPKDEDTFIGPMISEGEATRLHGWIEAAIQRGATLLCGGQREGSMLGATLLENVPSDADIVCYEAFGPVAVLSSFSDFDQALAQVNDSVFGLQAGIFTRDIYKAEQAWNELEVGGGGDRRRALVAGRPYALRRSQRQRTRARRHPLCYRRYDRNPPLCSSYSISLCRIGRIQIAWGDDASGIVMKPSPSLYS